MSLIQDLKRKYPKHEFEMDPETGVISFTWDSMCITDPFLSDCGRFSCSPGDRGLESKDAVRILAANMLAEESLG
jgi:hypothetical protein